ncbi:hypothetical protein MNBD_ALPHA08-225 [hydrothermal vent metagenome]|uniref:PPC domain-containing protein n=1 Tax=hydrothermal vent metagenome TaxID=652676 RepID=A0A3B0S8L9_9ZZZZ
MKEMMAQKQDKSNRRVVCARIGPNEDLVTSVEKICLKENIQDAFIRGSLGSLTSANLEVADGKTKFVKGPAVEILSLSGQIKRNEQDVPEARLYGVISDEYGDIRAGRFIPGSNNVCVTMELTVEEWDG